LLHNVFVVTDYYSDMLRSLLSAIFMELASLLTCAAYVSTYVGQTVHISVKT